MEAKFEVRHPEVEVQLTGEDGNIFFILGAVRKAMRRSGTVLPGEIEAFTSELTNSESYDAALQVVMRWVSVA